MKEYPILTEYFIKMTFDSSEIYYEPLLNWMKKKGKQFMEEKRR